MREITVVVVKWMIFEKRLYCRHPRVESEPEETPKGRVRVAEAHDNERFLKRQREGNAGRAKCLE